MQIELDGMGLARPVQILGVNEMGHESRNSSITEGRDLPWLQDTDAEGVWESWKPTYRDVIVLGPEGDEVGVFNLTDQDLGDEFHYDALLQLFVDASGL